jgi:hypothetical protein
VNLERGLIAAVGVLLFGLVLLVLALRQWMTVGFGALDYASTIRLVVPGVTATALGFQTILSSFFVSLLGMRQK